MKFARLAAWQDQVLRAVMPKSSEDCELSSFMNPVGSKSVLPTPWESPKALLVSGVKLIKINAEINNTIFLIGA